MSAVQVWDRARRRGFWARRAFAEDLRSCLSELVLAAELIAGVVHDLQPHASEATREAVDVAPFTLATTRDALAVRRPGMSAGDILDSVALNLRMLVDTCDGLRRGLEAALIQWERDPECAGDASRSELGETAALASPDRDAPLAVSRCQRTTSRCDVRGAVTDRGGRRV